VDPAHEVGAFSPPGRPASEGSSRRARFGVGVAAVLVLLLSGAAIPRWLLVVSVGTALLTGLRAGIEQKRMERRFARSVWNALTRR
jgi:hypothetical protein